MIEKTKKEKNKTDTVSKSFSFDRKLWERVEDARFKYRYNTVTDLVIEALEKYLIKLNKDK